MKNLKLHFVSIGFICFIGLLAYTPFAFSTGFYYNDWHPILGKITDTTLFTLFKADRPTLGIIYSITVNLFGDNPILWQLFAVSLRVLSGLVLYMLLLLIWPKNHFPITLMASLFVIYPGFSQQPIALTFSNHLLCLVIALISILLHVVVLKKSNFKIYWKFILIFAAIFLEGIYLFIYEYMLGLEIVRWILVWQIINPSQGLFWKEKFVKWLSKIWYFFLPLLGLLYFRLFIFSSARPTMNVENLMDSYIMNPYTMILQVVFGVIRAVINTTLFSWMVPLYNRINNLNFAELSIGIGISSISIILFYLVGKKFEKWDLSIIEPKKTSLNKSIQIGFLIILGTLIPIVLSNREVKFDNLLDRYTLQSAFGVTILMVGFAFLNLNRKLRNLFIGFFIGLSMLFNFSNGIYWKNHWDYQQDLFWQIYWRAPQIKPDSVVLALQPEGYYFREDEDLYAPLNLIYYPDKGFIHIVSEVLAKETIDDLIYQRTTYRNYRTINFKRDFNQALVISNTDPNSCVHIIDGQNPELINNEKPLIKLAAPFSNIDQIMTDRHADIPPENPFGKEPNHFWCYFYQKAQLARQMSDWTGVVELAKSAEQLGFSPNDNSEWLPFIEGYFMVGEIETTKRYIEKLQDDEVLINNFCKRLESNNYLENSQIQFLKSVCGKE